MRVEGSGGCSRHLLRITVAGYATGTWLGPLERSQASGCKLTASCRYRGGRRGGSLCRSVVLKDVFPHLLVLALLRRHAQRGRQLRGQGWNRLELREDLARFSAPRATCIYAQA